MSEFIGAAVFLILIVHFVRCAFRVVIRKGSKMQHATSADVLREVMLPVTRPTTRLVDKALRASIDSRTPKN